MQNLAIIPARSGSKGLPDKNIKCLDGKPLMAYSIEAALASEMFSEVMVSTDSVKYAEIARICGASVPFMRSEINSIDRASSWDVVREILENYKKMGKSFDTLCLLQPTSPLRKAGDITEAYRVFKEKNANTVVSVCEVEHSPLWSNVLPESLSMDGFITNGANAPRQKLDMFYRINGAVYIVDAQFITHEKNIYQNSFAYVMPQERSVDIDTEMDFVLAESILNYLKYNNRGK